jgi:hypothetical protein
MEFLQSVVGIKMANMEVEWDAKDEISFEINTNILSESFCLAKNYVIADSMREIMLIFLYIDYRLAISVMLKVIERIPAEYFESYFDILMQLKGIDACEI